jgi:hypothetical protein
MQMNDDDQSHKVTAMLFVLFSFLPSPPRMSTFSSMSCKEGKEGAKKLQKN